MSSGVSRWSHRWVEDTVVMDEFSTAEGVAVLISSFDPGMQVSSVVHVVTGSWDALGKSLTTG